MSATTAVIIPQCSLAASAATIPHYFSPIVAVGYENPIVQSNRLQHALAASVLQSQAILATVNSAAYSQQQLLPFNQLAVANSAAFSQQLFNPLAVAHPITFWQQQQLVNQLALMSPAAFLQQPIVGSTIF
ncbi:hypothetical protein PVAP13_8KG324052 [Panicum virgatum]|uniref:Z1A alpha zein protein n=1 Tax=Panicum virgatum TaxID=38727 RepID=A0A8T0PMM1_PANVG|nr:hypothetical protein PVAP13_8KG324052 [Panicum virgatum]